MPNWTSDDLRAYQARRLSAGAKSQRTVCDVPLATPSGTRENSAGVHVRFTCYRRRLIADRTNLEAGIKYIEDCLVYSGLIPGDSETEVTRTVSQVKIPRFGAERVEIEILPSQRNKEPR